MSESVTRVGPKWGKTVAVAAAAAVAVRSLLNVCPGEARSRQLSMDLSKD